jgi:hypothetical protein
VTARAVLLDVVAEFAPAWDADEYGGLLEDCAQRAIPPLDVLLQTTLAIRHGEGVREVRAALAPRPWNRPRKDT